MSDTDRRKVQIEASLDATGVREGAADAVAAAKGMAAGVEDAGRKAAQGLKPLETQPQQSAAAMSRAEKNMVGSIQRATVALQSGGKAGSEYYEILAKQRGISGDVLKPYIDQLRQVESAQKALRQSGGISEGQRSAALRGVPAQLQDVIVSLQGGQNAMTVALQQGSQLLTTFGTASEMVKGLGGYILGLVNPLTVSAAAAGVLAVAFYQGSQEANEYSKALILSGNAAGTTAGQLALMAEKLGAQKGITQSGAADALTQLAATGNVASESIAKAAEAVLRFDQAGVPIKNTVKDFEELGKSPVEASLKLTEQHRYLTSEIFSQIKALQDQGREAEAAKLAQEAYADSIISRTTQLQEHVGLLERAWKGLANGAKSAWDAMLGIGRGSTVEEQLQRQVQIVADLQKKHDDYIARYGSGRNNSEATLSAAQAHLMELQGQANEATAKAMAEGASQAREKVRIQWIKEGDKFLSKEQQRDREIAKARIDGAEGGFTDKEIKARIAQIEEKYKEKGGSKGANTAPAARRLDLSEIQNAAREEVRIIDGKQKDLERLRQSGLIDDQGYYSQKRDLILQSSKMEESALQEQISRLQQEKVKGNDALAVKKQIADTESKLATKRLETGEKLKALSFEESLALERQRLNLEALAASHQRAMEQMRIQQQRTVSSAWMGSKDRQRAESLWGIEDSYLAERRRLEDRRMFTANLSVEQRQEIDQRLAYLETEKAERIRVAKATYAELDQLQAQWELGAGFAMQNYVDQAANVAQQTADAFSNAFRGMEDALVKFVTTGKLSFTDLANNIVADITRIIIKQQISNALGIAGSGGSGGGLMGLIGAGIGMLGGSSAVATAASALPGDSLDNFPALKGLATGGYTGDGGKYEPAGIVHRGEYVINAESTKRIGLGLLSRLNGYSSGGYVQGLRSALQPAVAYPAPEGQSAGRGGDTYINLTVPMPQGGSRETAMQFGSTAGRQIAIAQSRNG
ncbi:phage tail tape measure protein [Comamonas sp.]|uniref:phage tail tape measure protein n=1 Tax=Comamonas sp. TaxID=34028 RepID=UPI003A8E16BF